MHSQAHTDYGETPGNNANALESNPTQCGFRNTPVVPEPRFDRDEFLGSDVLRAGLSDLEVLNSGDVGLSTLPSLSELFHATHVRPPGMVSGVCSCPRLLLSSSRTYCRDAT